MKGRVAQTQKKRLRAYLRWVRPGLHLKRWLLLLTLGAGLLGIGLATLLYRGAPLPTYLNFLNLHSLSPLLRGLLLSLLGLAFLVIALWRLTHAMLAPVLEQVGSAYPELLYRYRMGESGPHIVVLGGGHGQATILRGLKEYTPNLTAIVTVADDGGSSGRLRREMGILPPGDFRNCIAALADDESLVTRVLQYRFPSVGGLAGHSFGNLFISAMAAVTGSFENALGESSRVLAVQGRVLPSTLTAVMLAADVRRGDGTPLRVKGESKIPESGGEILRVLLEPSNPKAYPRAIQAILNADMIVIGPGSLYTSIMPNLLVPEIEQAIRASQATTVYVCNVATQPGETDRYTATQHVEALDTHLGPDLFDVVIINNRSLDVALPNDMDWVTPTLLQDKLFNVVRADLTSRQYPWQHDSQKLADVVMQLLS
jgi:uncharacterized cofD-like protein